MSMDRMGNELAALGVAGRDARCLLLLPQVYVGWVLERRDVGALEALLESTVRRVRLGPDVLSLARRWLFERPSQRQFQSAFALLRALRRAPEEPAIASSDVLEAMLWACRAAQLERRPAASQRTAATERPGEVSLAVLRALNDLEAWLEVDAAELWSDLLAADVVPARPSRVRATPVKPRADLEREPPQAPLEAPADEDASVVRLRDESVAPGSMPFPLLRRLA